MSLAWKRIEPTKIQKIGYRTIVTKIFVLPNGEVREFAIKEREDMHSVVVLGVTPDLQVIVARQFRPGPERIMDELPGGGVDPGEDLVKAAEREFTEETGYEVGEIVYLGETSYDAYSQNHRHSFLATNCTPSSKGQQLDSTEFIEVKHISIDELISNARQARMTDPGAVLLAYDHLQSLSKKHK